MFELCQSVGSESFKPVSRAEVSSESNSKIREAGQFMSTGSNMQSAQTAPKGKRSHSVGSEGEVSETVGSRRRMEDIMNNVRSQTRAQLHAFDPVEFKSTPVSTRVCEVPVDNTAPILKKAVNTNCVSDGEAQARSTVSDKQNSYHAVDSEIQIRARPRQPNSLSVLDPEAPTRTFGSNGQREVTVVRRPSGIPQALVSSSDKQWSYGLGNPLIS